MPLLAKSANAPPAGCSRTHCCVCTPHPHTSPPPLLPNALTHPLSTPPSTPTPALRPPPRGPPAQYMAWAELLLASFFNPRASFLGHLAGILAGLMHVYAVAPALRWAMRLAAQVSGGRAGGNQWTSQEARQAAQCSFRPGPHASWAGSHDCSAAGTQACVHCRAAAAC